MTGPGAPVFSFALDETGKIPRFLNVLLCICWESMYIYHGVCGGQRPIFVKFVFSIHLCLGLKDGTQTARPCDKHFYPLRHFSSWKCQRFEGQGETSNFTTLTDKGRAKEFWSI